MCVYIYYIYIYMYKVPVNPSQGTCKSEPVKYVSVEPRYMLNPTVANDAMMNYLATRIMYVCVYIYIYM